MRISILVCTGIGHTSCKIHFVELVALVMVKTKCSLTLVKKSETPDQTCFFAGRTNFYDKYGVIADVMQNHLSEILYLLTMELPMNLTMSNETMKNKFNIVRQIKTLTEKDIVMGQYQGDFCNFLADY